MKLNSRKKLILNIIVSEYIRTGQPVGSKALAEKYNLGISPATVRNEMMELEEEGMILQPYTSAGRVPTEKGFNYFIEGLEEKKASPKEKDFFSILEEKTDEAAYKETAKRLSEISGQMIFWAINKQNFYFTGVSRLLKQPEFQELGLIYDISGIIDRIDEIVNNIFEKTPLGVNVLIGSKNPFGGFCGSVIAKYKIKNKYGMFGIIGPMRMDYKKNISLIDYIFKKLNK